MELHPRPVRAVGVGVSSDPPLSSAPPASQTSFMAATRPLSSTTDYLQRSLTPGEATGDFARTNALADRNTIVDMSLRLSRFLLCVVVALIAAFGFALLTSNKKKLTYVYESKLPANTTLSSEASSVVEDYNTLFGYVMFTGGKVFEVFCETLIFPTLATYLHNCSLYPGDQPARVYSKAKARSIFWGLKTVIILMNVGFTSVYVGQTTENSPASRRLAESDELVNMLGNLEMPWAMDSESDVLHTILRTSVTGVTTPFEFQDSCQWTGQEKHDEDQKWGAWADDVDTTTVSFSFPSHAWNAALLSIQPPAEIAEIPLREYLRNPELFAKIEDWDIAELYSTFQQGMAHLNLASTLTDESTPRPLDAFIHVLATELKAALPDTAEVSELVLRLERHDLTEGCLGLSLPLTTGEGVLLVGKDALAVEHAVRPIALVTLHPATIPDTARVENEALTSWYRLVSPNGRLVHPGSIECKPLVDAYLTHIETNHFYLSDPPTQDMYSAALVYLLQRGVPTLYANAAISRRHLALSVAMASNGSDSDNKNATTDIEIAVPTATALVTVGGCIGIILLMLCVIYLPTARVKLSPDTTPAAQYVQILTDDLYPDVVHKKRLRFANGDCLLFNEYVVDAIVLHAKRDQSKKIYL
ncbi:hypothetical protein BBO99_00008424 [Phytophthora kernoviae]|uniref:Transmembrane protein n=2 Tax=Phytophthora kernoviae TaxID=325452 RepID=A0A3R7K2C0_9STRA|nr:hypothetical protein G195_010086 [Phytophthora kernoviae 00238/432]KAG2510783.1 hypothetical protein JM16_008427 [Phytophthora kernoviae]KAG2514103.1 hypothetical protein JM18_008427 [Phytophthora kernoviae]RLN45933.1 hypothetical protein BBI17_008371 [Phytophthora kernoviae]RLN75299.1 hypothetical protein BBO99_00008424 [Phytophthora kernoviae]